MRGAARDGYAGLLSLVLSKTLARARAVAILRLRMSRSFISRSLEPFVSVLWSVFLLWTVWTGAVWVLGIGPSWLGFSAMPGAPQPPNADLRRAVQVLAQNADLAWLALAAVNLHLVAAKTYGLRTARRWFAIAAGGVYVIGAVNHTVGVPFGWVYHSSVLGARLFGVSAGWMLLWVVLVIGSRETVLRLRPRASHGAVSVAVAVVASVTVFNLLAIAEQHRAWWGWHDGEVRNPMPMPWWGWLSWFGTPLLLAFFMRENAVADPKSERSLRPLVILVLLNALAMAVRVGGSLE